MTWTGLNPPYRTIVADPPWAYDEGWPVWPKSGDRAHDRTPLPYSSMGNDEITRLPVTDLAGADAHLYLWTTNRYLRQAFAIVEAWGFKPTQTLTWCKTPMGVGPGGAFSITTEFVVFGRRGTLKAKERHPTTWWTWARGPHSAKPAAFFDIVERVSPGPYVELFARQPRLGWDSWGWGYESP